MKAFIRKSILLVVLLFSTIGWSQLDSNPPAEKDIYTFKANVLSIYDGDTVRLNIHLGFGVSLDDQSVRLLWINAPEVRGVEKPLGIASRDYLRSILLIGDEVVIRSIKKGRGKYGRILVEIWKEIDGEYQMINKIMVDNGHAKPEDY